jgi:hypothetical protein
VDQFCHEIVLSILMITNTSLLSSDDLAGALRRLAQAGRANTVDLVVHLAEFDARGLHLALGYSSIFAYCCEVLRLPEHGAYNRIEAARRSREFPALLDMLRTGSLNLATVRILGPHLTDANHVRLLAEASGKSRREVEEIVAREAPRPDVVTSIRKLPGRASLAVEVPSTAEVPARPPATVPRPGGTETGADPAARVAPGGRTLMAPLAPDRYQVRFTASGSTCRKLREAQDLLRHAVPSGDMGEVVDRAVTLLLEDLARKKRAATDRPRPTGQRHTPGPSSASRHITAQVRRVVWARDGGRCAFVGAGGRRCDAAAFLEFHHRKVYAAGGPATAENIELRCRAHNADEADLFFGPVATARAQREAAAP